MRVPLVLGGWFWGGAHRSSLGGAREKRPRACSSLEARSSGGRAPSPTAHPPSKLCALCAPPFNWLVRELSEFKVKGKLRDLDAISGRRKERRQETWRRGQQKKNNKLCGTTSSSSIPCSNCASSWSANECRSTRTMRSWPRTMYPSLHDRDKQTPICRYQNRFPPPSPGSAGGARLRGHGHGQAGSIKSRVLCRYRST